MILIHTRAALISIVVPIRAIHARLQWEDREDRPLQDLPSITQQSRQVDPGKDVGSAATQRGALLRCTSAPVGSRLYEEIAFSRPRKAPAHTSAARGLLISSSLSPTQAEG